MIPDQCALDPEPSCEFGFYETMSPLRMMAFAAIPAGIWMSGACSSPASGIRPVIYADSDQAAAAMRTAPLIVVVRIAEVRLTGDVKDVVKPLEAGGPQTPTIPLHLARINADVLLTVQGEARTTVEFYSWIWASGSHGGPRLFHADPGGIRVIFLRDEGGYLHTAGDYPSYDLELKENWLPALLLSWKTGQMIDAGPVDRLVALRLRAEFEGITRQKLREDIADDGPRVISHWAHDLHELVRVSGPLFVATQLDDICFHSQNPSARFAACVATAAEFPGRCGALGLAQKVAAGGFAEDLLDKSFTSCRAMERYRIDDLRPGGEARWGFHGASMAPQRRRETLRVYATAMDRRVHRAACEAAARIPEADDLPECAGSHTREWQ